MLLFDTKIEKSRSKISPYPRICVTLRPQKKCDIEKKV